MKESSERILKESEGRLEMIMRRNAKKATELREQLSGEMSRIATKKEEFEKETRDGLKHPVPNCNPPEGDSPSRGVKARRGEVQRGDETDAGATERGIHEKGERDSQEEQHEKEERNTGKGESIH